MKQVGLSQECNTLKKIIDDLASGKESCEMRNEDDSLESVIDYLRGFLEGLKALDAQILAQGNTPELLKQVFHKYTELWLFQIYFYVESLPLVIGRLWRYPDCDEYSDTEDLL